MIPEESGGKKCAEEIPWALIHLPPSVDGLLMIGKSKERVTNQNVVSSKIAFITVNKLGFLVSVVGIRDI